MNETTTETPAEYVERPLREIRIEKAMSVLNHYNQLDECADDEGPTGMDVDCILADLMHLADAKGWNFSDALNAARRYYNEEVAEGEPSE
jgi:hypothetical protein